MQYKVVQKSYIHTYIDMLDYVRKGKIHTSRINNIQQNRKNERERGGGRGKGKGEGEGEMSGMENIGTEGVYIYI